MVARNLLSPLMGLKDEVLEFSKMAFERINTVEINFENVPVQPSPLQVHKFIVETLKVQLENIVGELKRFGKIFLYEENTWSGEGFINVKTGTRTVKMDLKKPIPSFLYFGNTKATVWYEEQEKTCTVFGSSEHLRKDCPRRGVPILRIRLKLRTVVSVIVAAIVLHNIAISERDEIQDDTEELEADEVPHPAADRMNCMELL
ncbi:hypothetical protein J437_LFUL016026 [Ladona fulva]|uniref:Uncharacterized protein n=1 Tax=Ladona fulva TaxID=123851 RepID=A0A8K0P9L0_LADFU|nr:hypothetical protein J437_LFUL016026 [Ladona fulva]